ncbi:MAG TPA: hypothetical protein DCR93_06335 [Cytophagales bacterium]|nr:hypothetical protein [Cytophagales bacterium]HAP59128.1 hypothetical protein [Cytophagales bacterium]
MIPSSQEFRSLVRRENTQHHHFEIYLLGGFLEEVFLHGVTLQLRQMEYRVFNDWKTKKDELSIQKAAHLRICMQHCQCLCLATDLSPDISQEIIWQLGFMDGQKGKPGIIPILKEPGVRRQTPDLLSLFPQIYPEQTLGRTTLEVELDTGQKCRFNQWLTEQNT